MKKVLAFVAIFTSLALLSSLFNAHAEFTWSGPYMGPYFSGDTKVTKVYKWTTGDNPSIVASHFEPAVFKAHAKATTKGKGDGKIAAGASGTATAPDGSTQSIVYSQSDKEISILNAHRERRTPHSELPWDEVSAENSVEFSTETPWTTCSISADGKSVGSELGDGIIGITALIGITYRKGGVEYTVGWSTGSSSTSTTIRQDSSMPSGATCEHAECTVFLPRADSHKVTCKKKVYFALGSVIRKNCNRKYYVCQTSTCPNDGKHIITHACGHEDEKEDDWKHAMQASCSGSTTRNGSTVYCQSTNFYLCQHDNHDWPPASNPPQGSTPPSPSPSDETPNCQDCTSHCSSPCSCTNSGTCNGTVATLPPSPPEPTLVACGRRRCTERVSERNKHLVDPCSACHQTYWSCGPHAEYHKNQHRSRTCRRSGCGNSWRRCQGPTPRCKVASGQGCWAR